MQKISTKVTKHLHLCHFKWTTDPPERSLSPHKKSKFDDTADATSGAGAWTGGWLRRQYWPLEPSDRAKKTCPSRSSEQQEDAAFRRSGNISSNDTEDATDVSVKLLVKKCGKKKLNGTILICTMSGRNYCICHLAPRPEHSWTLKPTEASAIVLATVTKTSSPPLKLSCNRRVAVRNLGCGHVVRMLKWSTLGEQKLLPQGRHLVKLVSTNQWRNWLCRPFSLLVCSNSIISDQ